MTSAVPHGGVLINRELAGAAKSAAEGRAKQLTALTLSEREVCDLEMIAAGAMSPLEGFMTKADYESCLSKKRLANGLVWTLPVTKSITAEEKAKISGAKEVALADSKGNLLAILEAPEVFPHDQKKQAKDIYGTEEEAHPGVAQIDKMGEFFVGGKISLFRRPLHTDFLANRMDPKQTREFFQKK